MFGYISSLAIIIFEALCCKLFFDSFCLPQKDKRTIKKVIIIITLIAGYYACGLMLSQWLVVKQLMAILITAGLMCVYFKITLKKSIILSMLYMGLALLVDYVAYAGNRVMFSSEGEVQSGYVLVGNLIIIFAKIILFVSMSQHST